MFLYVIEGGGVPDSDWNDPLPDLPHISDTELRNLRAAISRDMGVILEREIGSFRTTLNKEMKAHISKHIGEVCIMKNLPHP